MCEISEDGAGRLRGRVPGDVTLEWSLQSWALPAQNRQRASQQALAAVWSVLGGDSQWLLRNRIQHQHLHQPADRRWEPL